jgi:hypothetical protein
MGPVSTPPGDFSRRSFFLFLLLAPTGILFILLIILATQFKEFRAMVSPAAEVPEFSWSDSSRARLKDVLADLRAFSVRDTSRVKSDSLWISPPDLNLLLAASPVAASQGLRFQADIRDSLMIVRSTQSVQALRGRFAWMFKLMKHSGYLNARLEGHPELSEGKLLFTPNVGYLNGQTVPAITLVKRGGLSPADFVSEWEFYNAFVGSLAEVKSMQGKILFVRK